MRRAACWIGAALALALVTPAVGADAASQLRQRINAYSELAADFSQQVLSGSEPGRVLAESRGQIYLKKPRSFLMHTQQPEESVLFTRADGIYFYDPFVGQLNIYSLERAAASPFALLYAEDSADLWAGYEVRQQGESYVLTPVQRQEFKALTLRFAGHTLREVQIEMQDGNLNTYTLSGVHAGLSEQLLDYHVPAGTAINDER